MLPCFFILSNEDICISQYKKNQKLREEVSVAIKDLKNLLLVIHDSEVEAQLKDLKSQHLAGSDDRSTSSPVKTASNEIIFGF